MAKIEEVRNAKGKLTGYKMRVYIGRYQAGTKPDGTPIWKQDTRMISAPTKAELKRKEAKLLNENHDPKGTISFRTAFRNYIRDKEGVLSPASITNYKRTQTRMERHCTWFMDTNIHDITKAERQRMVSALASRYATNTVNAMNTTVASVLRHNDIFIGKVKVDNGMDATTEEVYVPSLETVLEILEKLRGHVLEPAFILAAFGPLRRGEIAALTWDDIDFETGMISVHAAQVEDENGNFIIKGPKTKASKRSLWFPPELLERIKAHDEICPLHINQITQRFSHFLIANGYKPFRFHSLRHFAASYYDEMGIPSDKIVKRGGWATDIMMKKVYIHKMNLPKQDDEIAGVLKGLNLR